MAGFSRISKRPKKKESGIRQRQLASVLQQELAHYLRLYAANNSSFINISGARVSKQVEFADVYVTIFGAPDDQQAAIIKTFNQQQTKAIRKYLSVRLAWRKTPEIRFHLDTGLLHARKIANKLEHANDKKQLTDK